MASSIKILKETKLEIDKLQAEILIKYGKKFTQQEILDILVKFGKEHFDEYFSKHMEIEDPERRKMKYKLILKKSKNWGIKTDENMIDEVLYGEKES